MMPPEEVQRIDEALFTPYSPNGVEGAFSELPCKRVSEVRQESFKDRPIGVAPLLAMLLH
jgi:hypothetical protein